MPLTTHTVTLDTNLPGPDGLPLEGIWTLSVDAPPSDVFKDTSGHVVFAGQRKLATTDGVVTLALPDTDQAGLLPAGGRWQLEFRSNDRKTQLGPYSFSLTANQTLDGIVTLADIPPAAVDEVLEATDVIMAARINDTASATSAALVGKYARHGTNVKAPAFLCNGTNERALLQGAIDAIVAAGGIGAVVIPGRVSFATPLDLTGLTACSFIGVSPGYAIGTQQQAALIYTGTGSTTAINAVGRKGLTFNNLNITYSSGSFTGTLLDLSGVGGVTDGTQHKITDCLIRAVGSVNSAANLVKIDKSTDITFTKCMFLGDKAVYGKATNASYSNIIRFRDCYLQGITTDPIWNPGDAWTFDGCVVEATPTTRLPKFIGHDAGVDSRGLNFDGCWVGDDNAAGAWVKTSGIGCKVSGGLWTMITSGGSLVAYDGSTTASGFVVEGAYLGLNVGAYVVDLSGFSGASAPLRIGVNGYSSFPTSLVNGTIPNGSHIVPAGDAAPYHYSRASQETWWADSSTRSLLSTRVVGESADRLRIRADGLMQWLDSAAATGTNLGLNSSGVLVTGNKAAVMDTFGSSTLAANGAVAFDARTFNTYFLTLNANLTSSTLTNGSIGQEVEIHLIQDATGGRTYVFPTSFKFAGGTAPNNTTASTRTIVRMRFSNGTNWYETSRSVAVPN